MEINFTGKRVLVTGAGRGEFIITYIRSIKGLGQITVFLYHHSFITIIGIGRDLVKALAKAGATVVALSKTKENLDSLKVEVPSIETVCADVSNWDETKAAVESVLPIDLLVNNAAIAECIPFLEVPPDSFDR